MDKYIYDERNGLWYELQGGLLHSLLGAAHLAYWLMGSAALAVLYTDLLISGKQVYLADIDLQASEELERLTERLKQAEGTQNNAKRKMA